MAGGRPGQNRDCVGVMFFDLTHDQLLLQATIRAFCKERASMSLVRSTADTGGFAPELWRELADLGVFGLRLPSGRGGAGLGLPDAAVVFEELGAAAIPGPTVAAQLAAGYVGGVASGERVVGDAAISSDGSPVLVEHFDAIDAMVVFDDDELRLFERGQIDATPIDSPLDPLTPVHRVRGLGTGTSIGGAASAARWRLEGAILTAAFQVGMARAVLQQAVDYAKDREQFGRPIGSFQAVKHRLADALVRVDVARAATHAGAVVLESRGSREAAVRAVSAAKLVAGEAAIQNASASIQVNGAMGFTWEIDLHLYLKRAWVLETRYGSGDFHAAAIAAAL